MANNDQRPLAVVTGGARRLGAAISRQMIDSGCNLVIHTNSSTAEADMIVGECVNAGGQANVVQADLADNKGLDVFSRQIISNYTPDILILNAANFLKKRLEDTTISEWDDSFNLNLRAPVYLASQIGQKMKVNGGCIIFIVDAAGLTPWPGYGAHSLAKAGLLPAIELLARDLAPMVRVNGIAPGPVLFPTGYSETEKQKSIERTLLKRAGEPEDIAKSVHYFCFNAPYVTGAVLPVDGGRHINGS